MHEPYVPSEVENPQRITPVVSGQPPVLISNSDLLEQFYMTGDALN